MSRCQTDGKDEEAEADDADGEESEERVNGIYSTRGVVSHLELSQPVSAVEHAACQP